MLAILRVKDAEGNLVSIPAIKGETGKDGYTPVKGVDYFDGEDGYTPIKGVDYFDGTNGLDGQNGEDGYTPVKGTDYWTEADKQEMIAEVIAALPVYNGEIG